MGATEREKFLIFWLLQSMNVAYGILFLVCKKHKKISGVFSWSFFG